MTIRYSRFDRVTAALTAKERGLLVLRSWKEGKEDDPRWRWTMPPEQVPEFNRLIGLMNGVNRGIGIYLLDLKAKVRELRLCAAWLATAVLWQCQVLELGSFIVGCTKELITESDYREKERGARAEYLPVAQLAYELTERHDGFTEEDLDPESAHDDAIVRPEAWERVRAEKAKEIARLVASGTLKGRGRGKALRVEAGSFYDWLGEPAPVGPAWAAAYEVVPDGEAERAAQHRFRREEAHTAYRKGPTRLVLHLPGVTDEPESRSEMDELVAAHRETFKEGI
ncbi:MAG: hypothetical protein Q8S13_07145, partial [Dehalococcoidia bacterium]|nr:hypothetical protein [Dehalococcoidia bacterium]